MTKYNYIRKIASSPISENTKIRLLHHKYWTYPYAIAKPILSLNKRPRLIEHYSLKEWLHGYDTCKLFTRVKEGLDYGVPKWETEEYIDWWVKRFTYIDLEEISNMAKMEEAYILDYY